MKMSKKVIAGVIIIFAIWVALLFYTGVGKIIALLKTTDKKWLPLITTDYVIGITGFCTAWIIMLRTLNLRMRVRDAIKIGYSEVFFNEVTPTASYGGTVARTYFAVKKYGLEPGITISSIVVHRAMFSLITGVSTLPLALFVILKYDVPWVILGAIAFTYTLNLVGWGVIFFLGLNRERAERLVERALGLVSRIKKVAPETKASVMGTVDRYNEGLRILVKRPDRILLMTFLALSVCSAYGTLATFSFRAMGAQITMEGLVWIFVLYAVIRMFPTFMPEWASSKELLLLMFFTQTGVTKEMAFSVIALMRTSNLLAFIILGGICTVLLGFKKAELKEMEKMKV